MKSSQYTFLSDLEKSKIQDLSSDRNIQRICKHRDIIKYSLQFFSILCIGWVAYIWYSIWFSIALFYGVSISLVIAIGYLFIFWSILKSNRGKSKELYYMFNKDISNKWLLLEDVKALRKKYFLEYMPKLKFLKNYIHIWEFFSGAELLTTYTGSSSEEYISNYCFLFKVQLHNNIDEKIQIIKIRNSNTKNFILALLLNICFWCLLILVLWYWSIFLILVTFYYSYKFIKYSSKYSWEQNSWNHIFDKKYVILWKKSGIIKKMKNQWFFDTFSEIMDRKTTYEIYIQGNVMYIKLDFLRSSPSRIFFIYTNIFNLRSSMKTLIDFYIDTIRIQKLKEVIESM